MFASKIPTLTALLLASALALPTAQVHAQDGGDDRETVHRQRVVINPLGNGLPCEELEGKEGFTRVKRAFLGVELTGLTPELRRHFGVPGDAGVMVGQVVEGSAAFRGGLQVGDILTRIDGRDVDGASDVSRVIRDREAGATVDLEYWRDGKVSQATVALGEKETCQLDISVHLEKLEGLKALEGFQGLEGLSEMDFSHLENLPMVEISEEALEHAREALSQVDWTAHLEQLQEIEIEGLDERMEELRVRMEELHERMAEENERMGEQIEKEMREKMKQLEKKERVRLEHEMRVQEEVRRAHEKRMEAEEKRVEAHERARAAEEAARLELEEELARARAEAAEKAAQEEGGGWV